MPEGEAEPKTIEDLRTGDTAVYFAENGVTIRGVVQAIFGNHVRIGGVLLTVSVFTAFLVIKA